MKEKKGTERNGINFDLKRPLSETLKIVKFEVPALGKGYGKQSNFYINEGNYNIL